MKTKNVIVFISVVIICVFIVVFFILKGGNNIKDEDISNSIVPSTGIDDTEESIIKTLQDNYNMFSKVAATIDSECGNFNCYIDNLYTRNITAEIDLNEVDINSLSISDEISIILKKLGFEQILEYQDRIIFIKHTEVEEVGLLYNKDIDSEIVLDITNSGNADTTFIQGNWFYYFARRDY